MGDLLLEGLNARIHRDLEQDLRRETATAPDDGRTSAAHAEEAHTVRTEVMLTPSQQHPQATEPANRRAGPRRHLSAPAMVSSASEARSAFLSDPLFRMTPISAGQTSTSTTTNTRSINDAEMGSERRRRRPVSLDVGHRHPTVHEELTELLTAEWETAWFVAREDGRRGFGLFGGSGGGDGDLEDGTGDVGADVDVEEYEMHELGRIRSWWRRWER